ncbi:scaffolding protein [Paenibacillus brevis]|uniref:Scaffolding protein n=1 Tax=Paenibacillus brevis TaxID=2841508 RepID=A0ABS6FSL9_9BACL|nr:scaffolding protein [Paenibacillus brevis]MBU5673239.1 scaffolding protein [Paenibacillus brevis]
MENKLNFRLPIDLQLFADGDGGGGTGDPQTFTEEQVKEREKAAASAAAAKAIKDRFGDLADMDLKEVRAAIALKKKADEDAAAAAAKSKKKDEDANGAAIAPEDVEKLLDERLKEREEEQEKKLFQRELRADVKVLASELGFADFEDALALADFSKVKRNDKGELEGVKEALEELAQKKPHLLKVKQSGGRFGADIGGNTSTAKKERLEQMKKLAQGAGTSAPAANDPWKR